jgi:hypothetical protein
MIAPKKFYNVAIIIKQFRTYLPVKNLRGFPLVMPNIAKAKKTSMQKMHP